MTRDQAIEKVNVATASSTAMRECIVDSLIALDILKVEMLPLGFDQISHRAGSETTKLILREPAEAGLEIVKK